MLPSPSTSSSIWPVTPAPAKRRNPSSDRRGAARRKLTPRSPKRRRPLPLTCSAPRRSRTPSNRRRSGSSLKSPSTTCQGSPQSTASLTRTRPRHSSRRGQPEPRRFSPGNNEMRRAERPLRHYDRSPDPVEVYPKKTGCVPREGPSKGGGTGGACHLPRHLSFSSDIPRPEEMTDEIHAGGLSRHLKV